MVTRSDNEFSHYVVVARLKDLWILSQQNKDS